MKFNEKVNEILMEVKKIKEPTFTIKIEDYNQIYAMDKKEFKSKYGITLVRTSAMGDKKTIKGTRENLIKMLLKKEYNSENAVFQKYPELKSDKEQLKDEIIKDIIEEYKKYYSEAEYKVASAILSKYDFTYDQMVQWEMKKLKVKEEENKEYISIKNRASVSSHTVSGEIKLLGKTYKVDNISIYDNVHGI